MAVSGPPGRGCVPPGQPAVRLVPRAAAAGRSTWPSCSPSDSTARGMPPSAWNGSSTPSTTANGRYVAGQIPLMWLLAGEIHRGSPCGRGRPRRRAVVGDRPVERRAGADPGAEPPRQAGQRAGPGGGHAPSAGGPRGVQRVHGRSAGDRGADRPPLRRRPRPCRGSGAAGLRPGHAARGRASARRLRAPARPDRPLARRPGPRRAVLHGSGHGAGSGCHDPRQRRRPRPLHPGADGAVGHAQRAGRPTRCTPSSTGSSRPASRRRRATSPTPGRSPSARPGGRSPPATSPTRSSPSTRRPATARRRPAAEMLGQVPAAEGRLLPALVAAVEALAERRRRPAGGGRRPPRGAGLPPARRRADRGGRHGGGREGRADGGRPAAHPRPSSSSSGATGPRPSCCGARSATA